MTRDRNRNWRSRPRRKYPPGHPPEPASDFDENQKLLGLDNRLWKVKVSSKGRHYWRPCVHRGSNCFPNSAYPRGMEELPNVRQENFLNDNNVRIQQTVPSDWRANYWNIETLPNGGTGRNPNSELELEFDSGTGGFQFELDDFEEIPIQSPIGTGTGIGTGNNVWTTRDLALALPSRGRRR